MTGRAMSFVGFHNSGKTTLVTQVAKILQGKGHRVGIIKSGSHAFELGSTDTGKLAATGCSVAGINPGQTMIVLPRSMSVLSAWPLLDADILLVEGGKSLQFLPRIILPRLPEHSPREDIDSLDNGLAVASWGPGGPAGIVELSSVEEVAERVLSQGFLLPALDCGACGRANCAALAREIVAGDAEPDECRTTRDTFSVTVNDVPLAMNPFVANIMASTIRGMLCQLKGYGPGVINIHLEES